MPPVAAMLTSWWKPAATASVEPATSSMTTAQSLGTSTKYTSDSRRSARGVWYFGRSR